MERVYILVQELVRVKLSVHPVDLQRWSAYPDARGRIKKRLQRACQESQGG